MFTPQPSFARKKANSNGVNGGRKLKAAEPFVNRGFVGISNLKYNRKSIK